MTNMSKIKIEKREGTIYTYKCPTCSKVIESLYEAQLIQLISNHLSKHEGVELE